MSSPLIAITTNRGLNSSQMVTISISEAYTKAVQRAGGIPVLLPIGLSVDEIPELRQKFDGVLFTGGGDIQPALYNGKKHPRVYDVDEGRDTLEINLVRLAAETNWPFFGICRGIQIINVALGGTLYSDIQDQVPQALRHDCYPGLPRDYIAHEVEIESGSQLAQWTGGTLLETNSLHHQAIEKVAPDLHAVAFAQDGITEAVVLEGHKFGHAVQWHPEWLVGSPSHQALFAEFIRAAAAK